MPRKPRHVEPAGEPAAPLFEDAPLVDEARRRYLSYALSVITARALPDARDGLKPVQRRILYTMFHELHLRSDARYRKSAAIVGDVMGKFHPHGDSSIYDALVRMAQDFSLRAMLVDGRGNFGSPDGDAAAAMRYTEAKLRPIADELLLELERDTVSWRSNYDGTRQEPTVLPARFPHLLVNGSQGIAVGMATAFPPHCLSEVIDACVALIDDPAAPLRVLLRHIKGPDFPTGGKLQTGRDELERIYASGQGSLKLYGEWRLEEPSQGNSLLVIHSIPYAIERRAVVEKIADVILSKKLPPLLDVRDESDEQCRIVCEIKKDSDAELIAAYLYRQTPLASSIQINLTALVPGEGSGMAVPRRLDLLSALRTFLGFRLQVVTRRLQHDLAELRARIHILEGFAILFGALDEAIRIIRKAADRRDAAAKLMRRFTLDQPQVDAILELRLYRLAQLEIEAIESELKEKRTAAKRLDKLLASEAARWQLIRSELVEIKARYGDRRRTRIVAQVEEAAYDADSFIVEEDAMVLLTQQGWLKRQQRIKDLASTRLREGDQALAVACGSTRASVALFSNLGSCFTLRIADVPPSSGHGTPAQTLFKMADGERLIAMIGMDERFLSVPEANAESSAPEPPYLAAISQRGLCLRFSLRNHREPSTRSGRRYCRLASGDEILAVGLASKRSDLLCASRQGRALRCAADEAPLLAGPGKGLTLIKLANGDELIAAACLAPGDEPLQVLSDAGKTLELSARAVPRGERAGKGAALLKRGQLSGMVTPPVQLPAWP